jgi:hypothetical protein
MTTPVYTPGPKRIQRKRTRGWRMPEGAVYVGRPTMWGNVWRFNPKSATSRRVAVHHYRGWAEVFFASPAKDYSMIAAIERIRGRDLACWCPLDQPCHADVLLELANQ